MCRLLSYFIYGTCLLSNTAYALRPFVTDDAKIVDDGQIETESWIETIRCEAKPGVDIESFFPKVRLVAEVFSGDPITLNAPRYATQMGMRYLHSDYIQNGFYRWRRISI